MHASAYILIPLMLASSTGNVRGQTTLDMEQLVAMGTQPAYFIAPNTLQGVQKDMTNAMSVLSNSANSLGSSFSTGMSSMQDMTTNRLNAIRRLLADGYANNEQVVMRIQELLGNPQQLCESLGTQAANAYKMASQAAIAAANTSPASLTTKFFSFGKK